MLSRRSILTRAALGAAGAGSFLAGVPACAQASLAKDVAGYQDSPKGPQRCELCKKFQAPSACSLVTGAVSPTGWCHFFSVTG